MYKSIKFSNETFDMTIQEVFPNPTVKNVVFQIRFSNLFYIENKIGDLQIELMKEFPESSILYRQKFILADSGADIPKDLDETSGNKPEKIWHFESPKKCKLTINSSSLSISSEFHKTYNNKGAENKFRDIIEFVLSNFFKIIQVPIIKRIGLRYIDECPIPKKNTELFKSYYESTFPLDRFKLENSTEMEFVVVTKKGKQKLRFREKLVQISKKYKLILDFDGFSENIKSDDCLKVTDSLHNLISKEYEKSLKEPVFKYMRKGKI